MDRYSSEPPSYPSIPSQSLGRRARASPPVAAAAATQKIPLSSPIFSPHSSCWNLPCSTVGSFAIRAPATAPSGPPARPPTVIPIIVRKNIHFGKLSFGHPTRYVESPHCPLKAAGPPSTTVRSFFSSRETRSLFLPPTFSPLSRRLSLRTSFTNLL